MKKCTTQVQDFGSVSFEPADMDLMDANPPEIAPKLQISKVENLSTTLLKKILSKERYIKTGQ